MRTKQINALCEELGKVLMKPFDFNGLKITVNYAARALHSKTWKIEAHYHPWYEFNYVSKGSLFTTINGKEFLINTGESYMIPPGVVHSHRHNNVGDDGLCIRFSMTSQKGNKISEVFSEPHPGAFDSKIDTFNLTDTGSVFCIQATFALWLMKIYDTKNISEPENDITTDTFAAQVILYLEEYHARKINAEDIANAMNTSYRTLARKFSAETGVTLSHKLNEIRIEHAKQLLISTNLSMYEIAQKTGFENEFYFSRKFKETEKISPKLYRKENFIDGLGDE